MTGYETDRENKRLINVKVYIQGAQGQHVKTAKEGSSKPPIKNNR
jgi:hypothetical protein